MLNSYANNSLSISAVSGSLQKSHPKSFFQSMHINSPMAKNDFWGKGNNDIVLQVMNTHEGWVIIEAVSRKDFEGDQK
jgi:hypothetical protein